MMVSKTNLEIVAECDSWSDLPDDTARDGGSTWYLRYKGTRLGLIPGWVFEKMQDRDSGIWSVDYESRSLELRAVTTEERTRDLAGFLARLRQDGVFRILGGWRDEEYPVYGPNRELVVSMERSATPLFGVLTYGVHMTVFTREAEGQGVMGIWVATRAASKQTYAGMLDNTVAGGLSTGEKPFEGLVREAREEASLPEDLVRRLAKACGTITYDHARDPRAGGETGLPQPECQYVYDLELDKKEAAAKHLAVNDDEVEAFHLMSVDEVQAALAAGRFKPNCAAVMLDFFIRHGILTAENEADYIEIISRLHKKPPYPTA